ncbi:MAG: hypothetical protein AAF404_18030, partial [Pseudomonadota bacterium]
AQRHEHGRDRRRGPDKPILIAEFGSAEPADFPDPAWGQNGDDTDSNQNKDHWVHDMLSALENRFPAIRAVSLFNINKELGWSITDAGNTGLDGMNRGLTSRYFVSEYISASDTGKRRKPEPGEPSMGFVYADTVITPEQQIMRARSRALPEVKLDRVEKMRQGFLNMGRDGRAQLSEFKHSVLGE